MKTSRLYLYSQIVRWLPETRFFGLKAKLLRWCGATIGENVRINSSAQFSGDGALVIGDDVWIGPGCMLSSVGEATIRLGSHIDVAPQVTILTGSHRIDVEGAHIGGEGYAASVEVGDGCWLGAKSLLLPGVILPKKTMVAAGAVVTKPIESQMSLVAGVPAKVARQYR